MSADYELFKGKKLSDLFEDIYKNQQNKKIQISTVIADIRKLVKTPRDLITIGPILSSLINSSITNDDSLLKMANVVQKMVVAESRGEGETGFLTDEERKQLLETFEEESEEIIAKNDKEVSELIDEMEKLKDKS